MTTLHGTVNVDVLRGRVDEANEIWGHSGNDDLTGGKIDDAIIGGKGDDRIWGDRGNDKIIGDTGDDTLYGSVDDDRIYGGNGNDWISGGKNDDSVFGGKDNDELHGNSGSDALSGGTGDDVLRGESGNDVLFGGWGDDKVHAGSGDDFVMASKGNDVLVGGTGFDTLDFSRMIGPVSLDLGHHWAKIGLHGQNTAEIHSFEQVIGTAGNDRFVGDRTDTAFDGGGGDDWFRGKLGSDVLTGGDGADTFVYLKKDTAGGGVDTVTDFEVGRDRLDMSDFLKGHAGIDGVRFAAEADGTLVQGLVKGAWTDVVHLLGVDHASVSHADLGIAMLV